jgi:2-polyprenyl-3-methyl-5-hydroxy-6-metoxy-1,4-benzoquinol methylase
MAHPERAKQQLAFLDAASLDELIDRYPAEWETVGPQLVAATASKRPEEIEAFVMRAREAAAPYRQRVRQSHKNPQVLTAALPTLVRARMAYLAAQRVVQTAALGGASGRVRFGLWSGFLIQRLFFAHGLIRKPVSMRAFRLWWPLVTQKRLLMPLVQPRGMYAFYSLELVRALAAHIGAQPCLEIGAGDGTLTRFLAEAGVAIRATDDQSWAHAIRYPADVEKMDAASALARYQPKAVVCSFPPPKNPFEQEVFRTASVDLYVVLTTRHRFAAGDWAAYQGQTNFDWQADDTLARMLLPPEINPQVLIFRRKRSV